VTTAAVIPAYNEAETVGNVVDVARAANLVDEVIVVDNGSVDDTGEVAAEHGARVIRHPSGGKGSAMSAGVAATDADVIVFLDADLLNLRPDHVDRLVGAVVAGGAGMALGLFDRGPVQNRLFLHLLPKLTGERAMRRELFESLNPADIAGYQVEAMLNNRAHELGVRIDAFVLDGMWHRTKEEKRGSRAAGWARKLGMLGTAMGAYVAYWTARRRRRSG
jgi:glycosyltransferase involved in cell wall biosynthesis